MNPATNSITNAALRVASLKNAPLTVANDELVKKGAIGRSLVVMHK